MSMNIFSHIYYNYGSELVTTETQLFIYYKTESFSMNKSTQTGGKVFGLNLGNALRKASLMPKKAMPEKSNYVKRELLREPSRYSLATFMQRGAFEFRRAAVAAINEGVDVSKLPMQLSIGCITYTTAKGITLFTVGEIAETVENGAYAMVWANNLCNPAVPYEVRRDITEGSCLLHTTSNTSTGDYMCIAVQVRNDVIYAVYQVDDFTANACTTTPDGNELAPYYVNLGLVWAGNDSFASDESMPVKLSYNNSNGAVHLEASMRRMIDIVREKIRNPEISLGAYIQHWRAVTPPAEGKSVQPDSIFATWEKNKERVIDLIEELDTEANAEALNATFVNATMTNWMLSRTVDKLLYDKAGRIMCVLRVQRMTADDPTDNFAEGSSYHTSTDLYRLTIHVVVIDKEGKLHYADAGQLVYGDNKKVFGTKCSMGIRTYGDMFFNAYKNGCKNGLLSTAGSSVYLPLQMQRTPVLSFHYPHEDRNTSSASTNKE